MANLTYYLTTVLAKASPTSPPSHGDSQDRMNHAGSCFESFDMNAVLDPIRNKFYTDAETLRSFSRDFGNIMSQTPMAVFRPTSVEDVVSLVKLSYHSTPPFRISARGTGNSLRGQSMVEDGIVVDMRALADHRGAGSGVKVVVPGEGSEGGSPYADAGAEQQWMDVLMAALEHGLTPASFTDYMHVTVAGSLVNAGVGGMSFRYDPQISNVLEMDVVTGTGELLTCSASKNSGLFYGTLGGLGQFGIITRARIRLVPAPDRVKSVILLYSDFAKFHKDQEAMISSDDRKDGAVGVDYLEGQVMLNNGSPYSRLISEPEQQSRVASLLKENGIVYAIEVAKYYNHTTRDAAEKELQELMEGLSFLPGFSLIRNVSYVEFLDRVKEEEMVLKSLGLWDQVLHPWLDIFVPGSRISDFNEAVFKNIVLQRNITAGLILCYPVNHNKWDDGMSVVIPDEDVFYVVDLLTYASEADKAEALVRQNQDIRRTCEDAGIRFTEYLLRYTKEEDWVKHYGSKWSVFKQRKDLYDPKRIFTALGIF